MPNCKVKGCPIGNGWYRGPKHTLFQFPKNESILKEWKNRIGMPNLQVSEHTRVCSKHFEDEAFVPDEENVTSRGKKRATRQLKPLAYPTLFLGQVRTLRQKSGKSRECQKVDELNWF